MLHCSQTADPSTISTWPDFDKRENTCILKYLKYVLSQELVMLMKPNMNICLLITVQVTNF